MSRGQGDAAAEPEAGQPPLRQPSFVRFWWARILTGMSFQMLSVAIGWQVYALTGSALALGLVGLAQFVPMVLLTLAVGHVADRYDRRRISAICQTLEGGVALALFAASVGGWINRDLIFILAALLGAGRAFENPTMQALLPQLVARRDLARATTWSASANQTAQIIGPAAGGFLYAAGPGVVYATAALCYLATAILIVGVRRPLDPAQEPARTALRGSIFSGVRYIAANRLVFAVTSLDLFAVFFSGATALLPIFARDVIVTGPWGLGLLRGAPAIGALCVSLILIRRPLRPPVGRTLFIAVGVFGGATILFGLSHWLALSMLALAIAGGADLIGVVIRQSLVQLQTPDAMRGRVTAVNALFVGASNQLGEFESGVTAALMGAVPAVLLGGLATIGIALAWMRLFPALAGLHDVAGAPPEAKLADGVELEGSV